MGEGVQSHLLYQPPADLTFRPAILAHRSVYLSLKRAQSFVPKICYIARKLGRATCNLFKNTANMTLPDFNQVQRGIHTSQAYPLLAAGDAISSAICDNSHIAVNTNTE